MPATATFETAVLIAAVQKANRIAPVKGSGFDRAAGLLFDVQRDPAGGEGVHCTIMSTDLDRSYRQVIPCASYEGPDRVRWRFGSALLTSIATSLPAGMGNVVEFIDRDDSFMRLKCNKFIGKLSVLDPITFPAPAPFDPTGVEAANEFASKVERVAWATENSNSVLSGVHIDGQWLMATDKYKVALVKCEVPVAEPITVPLGGMTALLKNATDVRLRAEEKKLLMQLDAETQATVVLIEGQYPNIMGIIRNDFEWEITISKAQAVEAIQRLMLLIKSEQTPKCKVTVNGHAIVKSITIDIEADEAGRLQDSIDCQTDFMDQVEFWVGPQYLVHAMNGCNSDTVTMRGGPGNIKTVMITDNEDYQVHIMPVRVT